MTENMKWTREPKSSYISDEHIEIVTEPHTDLWQRTYYHFRNDNAPVLQMETDKKYFSFIVKTDFTDSHRRFDQCGIVMYLDSENWLKASVEYENEEFQHLGSVVTNHGYSDWATTAIPANVKTMWYRFSRREDDYCIECSYDGVNFSQMRVCHMWEGKGTIRFGIYACSPEDSSFKAVFTDMKVTECAWKAHNGQQPDKLFDLAAKRRSVRRYTSEHIPDEVLNEIMKVALTAPCSFGHRPVEFVIVRDKIRELAECKSLGGSQIIGADAVIVVMVKLDRGEFWIEDGAIASSYILLAAEQYGGRCYRFFLHTACR